MYYTLYTRELKTYIHTKSRTQMFVAAFPVVPPSQEHPNCPSAGEQIDKRWYIHTIKYHSAAEKMCAMYNVDEPQKYYAQ